MYIRILKLEETTQDSLFLWGARQTGKSTLLITLFPKARRYDLLQSEEFERLFRNFPFDTQFFRYLSSEYKYRKSNITQFLYQHLFNAFYYAKHRCFYHAFGCTSVTISV